MDNAPCIDNVTSITERVTEVIQRSGFKLIHDGFQWTVQKFWPPLFKLRKALLLTINNWYKTYFSSMVSRKKQFLTSFDRT